MEISSYDILADATFRERFGGRKPSVCKFLNNVNEVRLVIGRTVAPLAAVLTDRWTNSLDHCSLGNW